MVLAAQCHSGMITSLLNADLVVGLTDVFACCSVSVRLCQQDVELQT